MIKTKGSLLKWLLVLIMLGGTLAPTTALAASTQNPSTAGNVDQLTRTQRQYINKKLKRQAHFTGTALFYRNGHVIYQQGYGYANYNQKIKNNAKTMYQWASVQKSVTAVLLMYQVQQGKVSLDDKLAQYYPNIAGGKQVTLRQMLDMRSGLWLAKPQTFYSANDKDIVNYAVENTQFVAASLNKWNYQAVNFLLLAGIIEQVSGRTYAQEANRVIFKPLHLKNTGFMPSPDTTHWATSYRNTGVHYYSYSRPETITKPTYNRELGTGNLYSTAGDLLHIQQAVIHGKIISKTALAQLRDATGGHYRGGIYNYADHVYARGCISGYENVFCLDKTGNTGVVLMGNRYFYGKKKPESHTSKALAHDLFKYLQKQ